MSQFNKTSPGDNPEGKTPGSKTVSRDWKGRRAPFIIAGLVGVLIVAIVFVSLYINGAPFRRIIIAVDGITINMDYFLMRTKLTGAEPMVMLERLTNEQLIKIEAPRYVAEVTPEDIEQALREVARGESETISDSEYKEWYRQLINDIGVSDSEYKEIVSTGLLSFRLGEYLAERVSTVAEQIHLYAILLQTFEEAEEARARWEAGEDFTDLARELSLDTESGEKGGDFDWVPRGILPPGFDRVAFDLGVGDVSEPLGFASDPTASEPQVFYYLLMVAEKAEAREINDDSLQVLKSMALDDWLMKVKEMKLHEIEWNFDSEIYAWINWQLTKE